MHVAALSQNRGCAPRSCQACLGTPSKCRDPEASVRSSRDLSIFFHSSDWEVRQNWILEEI